MPEVWIGPRRYATKKAGQEAVQAILGRYGFGQDVDQEDDDLLLRDLLDMHPDAAEKVGSGVDRFRIIPTPRGHHRGPEAVLVDGTRVAFSYQKCLDAPTHRQRVLAAMRTEIQPQVNVYYESRKASHTLVSDESRQHLAPDDTHVSYFCGPRFHDIAREFGGALARPPPGARRPRAAVGQGEPAPPARVVPRHPPHSLVGAAHDTVGCQMSAADPVSGAVRRPVSKCFRGRRSSM